MPRSAQSAATFRVFKKVIPNWWSERNRGQTEEIQNGFETW